MKLTFTICSTVWKYKNSSVHKIKKIQRLVLYLQVTGFVLQYENELQAVILLESCECSIFCERVEYITVHIQ